MKISSNEFVWKGQLFRRMPDTGLFVSFQQVLLPCPMGRNHQHPGLGIVTVEEDAIDRMIFESSGFVGSA